MNNIRKAVIEDIDWIVDIGIKDMFSLLGNNELYNQKYLKTIFLPILIEKEIVLVVENYGVIIGSVGKHPFNPDKLISCEFMWWVREDKRNSTIGIRLLKEFEIESKNRNASYISISLLPTSNIKSLNSLGYINKDSSLLKEI